MIRKYFVDVVLLTILIALVAIILTNRSANKQSDNNNFTEPIVTPATKEVSYKIQIGFTNPSALYEKILSAKVIGAGGEKELGSFVVKDIRLWNLDGTRIIDDQFTSSTKPDYITIYEKIDGQNRTLYEGDITGNAILKPKDNVVASDVNINLIQ